MVDVAAEKAPVGDSWRHTEFTPSVRDVLIALVALVIVAYFFISIDVVETLFELTRDHEDWELDEFLACIPALIFVTAWYAFRRWLEAGRLSLQLKEANEALKANHARILAAETQMRDAQRLESLGRLAGGLAHELNNMLQPIITLSKLTLKDTALPDAARTNLEKVLEASECSRSIVSKTLTFARGSSPERERVVLSSCLKEAVDFSRTALPSTVALKVEITEGSEAALISRTELTQVLANLMTNAVRAMNGKGILAITHGIEELTASEAGQQGLAPGRYHSILVSDNGSGMAEDVRRRLFDPFFTTGEAGETVGLGLAVVHGIIDEWRGRISVSSQADRGTCFAILLPIADD